jgi:hypothetical protein
MSTPVTEIDPRFSDADAAVTEWSETLRAIERLLPPSRRT